MSDSGLVTVDARGMRCPWPALRLARAMRCATAARLISDDPRAEAEAAALAAQCGWTFTVDHTPPLTTISVSRPA